MASGAALVVLVLVGGAPRGVAHGGEGVIEVGDPIATGELEVEFPIRITYEVDGHAAEEVSGFSVSGVGPGGAMFGPGGTFVEADAPGVHTATVTLPSAGQWELIVEVSEPPASASLTVEVAGAPDQDDAPEEGDTAAQDDSVGSGAGSDDGVDPVDADDVVDLVDEEDSGIPIFAVGLGLAAAVVAGVIGYRWSVSRSPAAQAPTTRRRRPPRPGGPS